MDETDKKVLDFLKEKGRGTSGEIAKALGVNRSTASRHLQYLLREGHIEKFDEKGHTTWKLKPQEQKIHSPLEIDVELKSSSGDSASDTSPPLMKSFCIDLYVQNNENETIEDVIVGVIVPDKIDLQMRNSLYNQYAESGNRLSNKLFNYFDCDKINELKIKLYGPSLKFIPGEIKKMTIRINIISIADNEKNYIFSFGIYSLTENSPKCYELKIILDKEDYTDHISPLYNFQKGVNYFLIPYSNQKIPVEYKIINEKDKIKNDIQNKMKIRQKESLSMVHGIVGDVKATNVNIIENLTIFLGEKKIVGELPPEAEKYTNRAWLIIPKKDSNGNPVSSDRIQSYKDKVYNRFDGWTIIPDIEGIYFSKRTGKTIEDDNLILLVCFQKKDADEGKQFLRNLASEIAMDLGQELVNLIFDKGVTEFQEGRKRLKKEAKVKFISRENRLNLERIKKELDTLKNPIVKGTSAEKDYLDQFRNLFPSIMGYELNKNELKIILEVIEFLKEKFKNTSFRERIVDILVMIEGCKNDTVHEIIHNNIIPMIKKSYNSLTFPAKKNALSLFQRCSPNKNKYIFELIIQAIENWNDDEFNHLKEIIDLISLENKESYLEELKVLRAKYEHKIKTKRIERVKYFINRLNRMV